MGSIRALIVDDQELFASGIAIILKSYGKEDIAVVGIARDGLEAVRKAERLRPDVVLMDVRMPLMDGVKATKEIHRLLPETKILILTTFDDDQYVYEALANGAIGYVLKSIQPEELVTSIKAVHAGNIFFSPSIGTRIVQNASEVVQAGDRRRSEYQADINFLLRCFETLTPREAEVLHLVMDDLDNRQIAEKLSIAEQTVRNHVSALYEKLGVSDRVHVRQRVKETVTRSQQRP
jgi:DNA-binding NarL/FixJ family response regulator